MNDPEEQFVCPQCGTTVYEADKVCPKCGTAVGNPFEVNATTTNAPSSNNGAN